MAGEPTWPTFSGADGSPKVETIGGRTEVIELQSGGRYPVSLNTTVRYVYTFRYAGLRTNKAAPAPYAAMSEAACVRSLLDTLDGAFGACYVVDPIDGVSRLCRLDSDSVVMKKVRHAPWYEAEITFRSI